VLEQPKKVGDITGHYKPVLPKFPFIPHGSAEEIERIAE
jgi:hypothetical protein